DGIRDRNVTGVQTCALPISPRCSSADRAPRPREETAAPGQEDGAVQPHLRARSWLPRLQAESPPCELEAKNAPKIHRAPGWTKRSEERRVGKECRYRTAQNQ